MNFLINIDVDDIDRAIAFYTNAFDMHIGRRLGDGAVELLGGSAPIYLLAQAAGSVASPASTQLRNYDRHWTPVHLDFVVDDVEIAVTRAVNAGATQEQAIQAADWGKLALMADPFGHGFCLVQFVGRGYDAIATQS